MVAALHHLNLTDAFDGVYGSSAGTLIGAYFLSRQLPLYGCSIYYEQFPSAGREFLDLRNIARTLGLASDGKDWSVPADDLEKNPDRLV